LSNNTHTNTDTQQKCVNFNRFIITSWSRSENTYSVYQDGGKDAATQ